MFGIFYSWNKLLYINFSVLYSCTRDSSSEKTHTVTDIDDKILAVLPKGEWSWATSLHLEELRLLRTSQTLFVVSELRKHFETDITSDNKMKRWVYLLNITFLKQRFLTCRSWSLGYQEWQILIGVVQDLPNGSVSPVQALRWGEIFIGVK